MQRSLILASKSPRRAQLLQELGLDFTVRAYPVEEDFPPDLPVKEVAQFLARKKALAGVSSIAPHEVLLAADTTVVYNNHIYHKPKDAADAHQMLRDLSGEMHQVITGVCFMGENHEITFSDTTEVWIDEMTDAEIEYYIEHYRPFDKAGAYAIQEWIGLAKIGTIHGSYSNVVGLPTSRVYEVWMQFKTKV